MNSTAIDAALRLVDREVWIVTSAAGQRRGGLVATWVMQGSLDPESPLLVAALAPNHYTTELVEASGALAAHLVSREQISDVWHFALGSGRTVDKLAGVATRTVITGAPVLVNCLAWFDCRLVARYHAGDRIFYWAEVLDGDRAGTGEPLREKALLAAATEEQNLALRASREGDIELQRPLRQFWLRK